MKSENRANDLKTEFAITRVRQGDSSGLSDLYLLHGADLQRILESKLPSLDKSDCDAITWATLWNAWYHIEQYDANRSTFRAWLFGIGRHLALDALRRNRRYARTRLVDPAQLSDTFVRGASREPAETQGASVALVRLREVLQLLPERDRRILLKDVPPEWEEKWASWLASEWGERAGTIRVARNRLLKRLRKELATWIEGREPRSAHE